MWITRVSINNPVFATMVMVGITVLGLFSYTRLRVEQMPDVTLPVPGRPDAVSGRSPEAVEIDVTQADRERDQHGVGRAARPLAYASKA